MKKINSNNCLGIRGSNMKKKSTANATATAATS
jgi:hypothetical protein